MSATEITIVIPYPRIRLFLTFIFFSMATTSFIYFIFISISSAILCSFYITSPYLPFLTSPKILPSTRVITRFRMRFTKFLACVAMITVVPRRLSSPIK